MQPRISMITLAVKDLTQAIKFYEKGLGFPRLDFDAPQMAFFDLNGTWLGLYGAEALAEDANVPFTFSSDETPFYHAALAHNVASEKQVDAVLKQAQDAGAEITKPAQKVFWGGYSGYFRDLDGHLWEIAHNPFMWVGPKDKAAE